MCGSVRHCATNIDRVRDGVAVCDIVPQTLTECDIVGQWAKLCGRVRQCVEMCEIDQKTWAGGDRAEEDTA